MGPVGARIRKHERESLQRLGSGTGSEGVPAGLALVAVQPMGVDDLTDFGAEFAPKSASDGATQAGSSDGTDGASDWTGDEADRGACTCADLHALQGSGDAAGGTGGGAYGRAGVAPDLAGDGVWGLAVGTVGHE